MKTQEIIIFIIVVIVVAVGAFFVGMKQAEKKFSKGLEEIMEKAGAPVVNPIENLPSANPFEGVSVNPFEGGYENPFK